MQEPSSINSAFRNVAQICGYYRQEGVKPVKAEDGGEVSERLNELSDKDLVDLIEAGAVHAGERANQSNQSNQFKFIDRI